MPSKASELETDIQVIPVADAFGLRRFVLRPMLPAEASHYEFDDHPAALHLGAFGDLGTGRELVGVVSFLPRSERGEASESAYELQAMVTLPAVRNSGIGARLARNGIAVLEGRGAARVWCNGRSPARSFYERLGFRVVGDEFVTPGTGPHYRFVKDLGGESSVESA
ncbi:MAG: GNAT family N-acetyltransferase [Acidimicrobiia bacterium]